jgi:hypothetical protein
MSDVVKSMLILCVWVCGSVMSTAYTAESVHRERVDSASSEFTVVVALLRQLL